MEIRKSALPYCTVMMSDGIKAMEEETGIATHDIAELVAAAMVVPSALAPSEAQTPEMEPPGTARSSLAPQATA